MKPAVFILFDPDKMIEELERVKRTHPKLNETAISEIVFSETIGPVFTKEQYANIEMKKQRRDGKSCMIVKRFIDDPDRLIRPQRKKEVI